MRGGLADSWTLRVGRSPTVLIATVAIGGILASAVLVSAVRGTEGSELRRLAAAVGVHRVTRARLTGGFAYAPCDTTAPNDSLITGLACPGAPPAEWEQAGALSKVAAEMRAAGASESGSASRRHAAGSWHLIWGDAGAAVDELRAAARLDPADARIQSDLAAAFLARAEREQDPRWILDAYDAADSALALDPRLAEARFNRAVALEWLYLRADAVAAWSSYLEVDDRSPWADEAREHLRVARVSPPDWRTAKDALWPAVAEGSDSAVRAMARRFPSAVREELRGATLVWARAHQAGAARSDTLLPRALSLAGALAAVTSDSLWRDAIRGLVQAAERGERSRLDAAARGFVAYDEGNAYLRRFAPDSARRWMREAEQSLAEAQNAARYMAAWGVAQAVYLSQPPSDEMLAVLRRLRAATPNEYRVVRALAARTEGVIQGIDGNYNAAITAYLTAVADGMDTGDPGLEIVPHASLAANYGSLGLQREAWRHLYAALRSSPRYADARSDARSAFLMAGRLSWKRTPRVALRFQREAVRLSSERIASRMDSLQVIGALEREAELFARMGRAAEARASLRRARTYLDELPPDSTRAAYVADADLVGGLVWLGLRPDSATRVLSRVVARYRSSEYRLEVGPALLLLANAYVAVGAVDSAQRAFNEAIAETERQREEILDAESRARFLDQARPVIDRIAAFLVDRADTLGALEFLERMRGRVLLERVADRSPDAIRATRSVEMLRSSLAKGTTVVSYAVLDRELVIWLIDRERVSMVRVPDPGRLEDLASRFSTSVATAASRAEMAHAAAELHRLLIAPVAARVERNSRLIFVPDKWLHFVPFAALFDAATGKFVVEEFEIGIAPSLELYAQSALRYQQLRTRTPPAVLAVGNPAFDSRMSSLPRLPGAESEARRVAAYYPGARLLVGAQATKPAFLQALAGANVVHFAGHGVVRPDAPLLSHLVLASGAAGEASGTLSARDLFGIGLPTTRLAILSGCHTASGYVSDTEGASSLARALFAAGVPAVVASLWAVDDRETAEFFAAYHRRLSQGDDPTVALRRTQLEWIGREGGGWADVSTWAAFVLFGATASGT